MHNAYQLISATLHMKWNPLWWKSFKSGTNFWIRPSFQNQLSKESETENLKKGLAINQWYWMQLTGSSTSHTTSYYLKINRMDLLESQAHIWMWLWDILILGTLRPLDPGTLGVLDFVLTPFTYFYILLFLPTSFYLLLPPGLVWFGRVLFLSFDLGDWDLG